MEVRGYGFRLYNCFAQDPEHYKECYTRTLSDILNYKRNIIEHFLPKYAWPTFELETKHIATAYHTYKGKCLERSGRAGLSCKKSHMHEREIISNFHEPCKKFTALWARALRLCKFCSGEDSWTLWNQSNVASELHKKVQLLQQPKRYRTHCPCGTQRDFDGVSAIKVDAAQFFKEASVARGKKTRFEILGTS